MYELFIIKIHNISYFGQISEFVEIVIRVKENNKIPLTEFFFGLVNCSSFVFSKNNIR